MLTTALVTNVFTAIAFTLLVFIVGVVVGRLVQHRYEKKPRRTESTDGPSIRLGHAQQPSEGGQSFPENPLTH